VSSPRGLRRINVAAIRIASHHFYFSHASLACRPLPVQGMYIFVCMYIYTYMCIHTHTQRHTHTKTHTHTHAHMPRISRSCLTSFCCVYYIWKLVMSDMEYNYSFEPLYRFWIRSNDWCWFCNFRLFLEVLYWPFSPVQSFAKACLYRTLLFRFIISWSYLRLLSGDPKWNLECNFRDIQYSLWNVDALSTFDKQRAPGSKPSIFAL